MTDDDEAPILAKIAEVDADIDKLMQRYAAMQIPPPTSYRLGDNEFIFRCQSIALVEIIREKLGISEYEFDLKLKQVWLRQAEMMFKNTSKIKPDKPKMFLPPGMEV